jgi:hypothetical protein
MDHQPEPSAAPRQGDCVRLRSDPGAYQVIGVDDRRDRCWVRRWPLDSAGNPVFEVSLRQVRRQGSRIEPAADACILRQS